MHTIPNVVKVPEIATVVPELELALISDHFATSFPLHSSSLLPLEFVGQLSVSCIHESTPMSAIGLFLLGLSESSSESHETIPILHSPCYVFFFTSAYPMDYDWDRLLYFVIIPSSCTDYDSYTSF
jgi:hypothetical protein